MIDKVQKIREEVERLMYGFNLEADVASCEDAETEKLANIKYQLCKKTLEYIDKVHKEPVSNPTPNEKMPVERWKEACEAACCDRNYRSHYSLTETRDDYFVDGVQWADEHPKEESVSIWHGIEELPMARDCEYILVIYKDTTAPYVAGNKTQVSYWDRVDKWAYVDDLVNLSNVQRTIKDWKEESVSNPIDFEKELYKAFGQVKDFTLGMRIAKWFYDMGKQHQEPVSEDLGEYINELSKQFPEVSFAKLSRIAVRVAKWQKEQDQSTIELAEDHAYFAGRTKTIEEIEEKLLSEVLPCFMHGGEADEVVAKLDEVLNQKK